MCGPRADPEEDRQLVLLSKRDQKAGVAECLIRMVTIKTPFTL